MYLKKIYQFVFILMYMQINVPIAVTIPLKHLMGYSPNLAEDLRGAYAKVRADHGFPADLHHTTPFACKIMRNH